MVLSNKVYDTIKFLTLVLLPGLATLYFAVAQIWGLPKAEEVVGTISAISVFLGVLARVSTSAYLASPNPYDGDMVVINRDGGGKTLSMELNGDPARLLEQKTVTFRMTQQPD